MTYKLAILPEGERDVRSAVDFYESISPTLADRFLKEWQDTLQKVSINPKFYKYVSVKRKNKYRCTRLKHFPFLVIFGLNYDHIVVVAVLHTFRKNKYI